MEHLKITPLVFARRVVAALEQQQQAEGAQPQVEALRLQLAEARDELAYAYNIIENRNMRQPGASYKTELLSAIADLVDRDVRREIGADHAETKQQLVDALDRLHQLEQVHDQQNAVLAAARNNVEALQRDLTREHAAKLEAIAMMEGRRTAQLNQTEAHNKLLREVSAVVRALESQPVKVNELRRQLAEANEQITRHAEVIKELHKQYHELEARKMATQYDLDRTNDEIAAAEAEIAKYKPLVDAVRAGHVYAWKGQWAQLRGFETEQTTGGSLGLITITGNYYAGVIQCL